MKRQDFLLKLCSTLPLILSIYVNMFKMKYAIIGVIFFKNCFVSPVSLQSSTTYFKLFGKGKSYVSFHWKSFLLLFGLVYLRYFFGFPSTHRNWGHCPLPFYWKLRCLLPLRIFSLATALIDEKWHPANIYLFKVNNGNTGKMGEICPKLTMKTPERRH